MAGGGFQIALNYWQRMSEFTSDRAGLLVCQDPKVCIRAMIKIFENIDDKSIEKVEVPTGDPIFYKFSEGNVLKK